MTGDFARLLRPGIAGLRAYEAEDPGRLVKLDANENPYPPPPALRDRVAHAAGALALNRYPDPEAASLRKLLATRCGWKREGILLGNGSDELIVLLLAACGGEGATLLVPTPTFSMYRHIALTMGWRVEEVPLTPGFALDEKALLTRAAAVAPRLSVFATPNNPTGNLFDRAVLERYLNAVEGVVVIDEAYHDFAGSSAVPLLERHANLVILQTLSKIGLAALRLGILLTSPELAQELNKVRLPYNVGAFPQTAAQIVLESPEYLEEQLRSIRSERVRIAGALACLDGVTVYPSDANFILFRTVHASRSVFEGLRSRGVLVRDLGGQPGPLQGCLRVTVGSPAENQAFLETMPHALRDAATA